MDYLYENLGDERFQQFCHSLLSKEHPNSQAFPVGQPDGGRDSLAYISGTGNKNFRVFQVKYVRNVHAIEDPHKWLLEQIESEAPKVAKLIPKGAISYHLITNVKGTAHLDAGSIDKLTALLKQHIAIPSMCWWRDDLSRLVEKDPLFLWSYPQILNGQDVFNNILFNHIHDNKERRESVIRAYLADQYSSDSEVKFKQIDLQNRLLDLFTDVPIRLKKSNTKDRQLRSALHQIDNHFRNPLQPEHIFPEPDEAWVGAASFLLHPIVQERIRRVLLEGGPGQGKSTIVQYVSQVHRARLLNRQPDVALIPSSHHDTPIRLPFKIDLRHVAAWVEQRNPYEGTIDAESFKQLWRNSLESFLVAHISFHSHVLDFNSSDLLAILRSSAVLFVFDGFDEIATAAARKAVIECINKGLNRLVENCPSIQVIVTSRPSVFSESVGFNEDVYPHFELTEVTPALTKEYVDKWIRANKLDGKEAAEINRLVREKLEMPHLRDLAKSPMQLAIFISLLRTKGESLPNKRTALYDSYVTLLFDRESEKSTFIRDHRDLIIDIHQYLGWILHSEAELYKNSGSIHIDELKKRLREYLTTEGHNASIADSLFDVVKDRVCALASRVQGTYEFEVQPLREYFCAKYLYVTAPHSPAGFEKTGTKPDRFDAIARNGYWQNVTRFFAGCFDKGELPMLIQQLRVLQNDELLRHTHYPSAITAQILSDWVFTQYPILMKEVASILVEGVNTGSTVGQGPYSPESTKISLPLECGREALVAACFTELKKFPKNDYALELIHLIRNNPFKTEQVWLNFLNELDEDHKTQWLSYGYQLGVLHQIDPAVLTTLVTSNDLRISSKRIQILIRANRLNLVSDNLDLKKRAVEGILSGHIMVFERSEKKDALSSLSALLNKYVLSSVFENSASNAPFIEYVTHRFFRDFHSQEKTKLITDVDGTDEVDIRIRTFFQLSQKVWEEPLGNWATNLTCWDTMIESARSIWGDRWSLSVIASIAAAIKSRTETYEGFGDLGNSDASLCNRVRHARLRSGNTSFWQNQFSSPDELMLKLLVALTWGTPRTLTDLISTIDQLVQSLTDGDYVDLANGLTNSAHVNVWSRKQQLALDKGLKGSGISERLRFLLSKRFSRDGRKEVFNSSKSMLNSVPSFGRSVKLNYMIEHYLESPSSDKQLESIRALYAEISNSDEGLGRRQRDFDRILKIPYSVAQKVMKRNTEYPRIIASLAERVCRSYAFENQKAVGLVAIDEGWFPQSKI